MSLNRDGENLLNSLNNQRVRELLSSHVPQDEAKLLSNGRLTCMICLHRPVFDTINMLSIHRKGKRHVYELSKHIQCIEDGEMRRRHADVESDLTVPLPRTKFSGAMRYRRRPILEIQPTVTTVQSTGPVAKSVSATVRHYLKSMTRKSSLDKVVEKNRENYGVDLHPKQCTAVESEDQLMPDTGLRPHSISQSQNYEVQLRMSGWIKDSLGKWVKDPNVEFDSDEEEAPPQS